MAKFYCKSRLGEVRHLTPEGTLICVGVPIARTGDYEYYASEGQSPGIQPGLDGKIISRREPGEVFDVEALASFEGKPVTLDHPPEDVTPENWKRYAVGHLQNVRQGQGEDADKMVADLVISDAAAIRAVNADGVREISCGYEAELEQAETWLEYQRHIRGNHAAIVREGRAGHGVAIKDRKGDTHMAEEKNESVSLGVLEKVASIFGVKKEPEPAPVPAADPAQEAKTDEDVEALKAENASLKAKIDELEKKAESEEEKTLDAEMSDVCGPDVPEGESKADSLGLTARVAILAPDMRMGKVDSKADKKAAIAVMRRALDRACDDDAKREVVESFTGKCDSVADLADLAVVRAFKGASSTLRVINNGKIPAPVTHKDSAKQDDDPYNIKSSNDRYEQFRKENK